MCTDTPIRLKYKCKIFSKQNEKVNHPKIIPIDYAFYLLVTISCLENSHNDFLDHASSSLHVYGAIYIIAQHIPNVLCGFLCKCMLYMHTVFIVFGQ